MKVKRPVGKPKVKLEEKLPINWRVIILDNMGEGASLQEIKAMMGLCNSTHERFLKENTEYAETIKKGIELSEAWWIRQGRVNLQNKVFSFVGWYMNMKNRFGWKDKTETDLTSDGKALEFKVISYKEAKHG